MNQLQKLCALFRKTGFSKAFFSGVLAGMGRIAKRNIQRLFWKNNVQPDETVLTAHRVYRENPGISDGEKCLYLTFDVEWKKPENLALVLDALQERSVPATFFLLGEGMSENAAYVRRIRAEGHAVGNHTMTHPVLPRCGNEEIRRELSQCDEVYRAATGEDLPKIMRPPYGEIDRRVMKCLYRMGYQTFLWNMHVFDWKKEAPATWDVFKAYLDANLQNGAIILQHTFSDETAAHIGKYIDYCTAKGYRFGLLQDIR